MRYLCNKCERYIKDKFIFGLMHICITDEEYRMKEHQKFLLKRQMDSVWIGSPLPDCRPQEQQIKNKCST